MPIVFNEPLSFLQRITEYMEHTYLIHKACAQSDSIERMRVKLCIHTDTHLPLSSVLYMVVNVRPLSKYTLISYSIKTTDR